MTTGRGAWTTIGGTTPYYELHTPNVGSQASGNTSVDPNYFNYRAVTHAVAEIQKIINSLGYSPKLVIDGWFGRDTQAGVIWAQKHLGLYSGYTPGRVGHDLSKGLLKAKISSLQSQYLIPHNLLYGIAETETNLDLGAVGYLTPWDKGVLQFNCDPATNPTTWWNGSNAVKYTVANAFDHNWALTEGAKRLARARNRYSGKGSDLQVKCMAAQHNAPTWADEWYASGVAPNPTIQKYVSNVLNFSLHF